MDLRKTDRDKKAGLKEIGVNLDWQKDRELYRSIYERQVEIRR